MPRFNLLIFFLFFIGHPVFAKKRILNETVVTVNGDAIYQSDVTEFMAKARLPSFSELFGNIDPSILKDRQKVIQLLVEEKIIEQQVKKLQLNASDAQIDGQIRSIIQRNGITAEKLKLSLANLGTSMKDYRAAIKRQIERKDLIDREIKPNLEKPSDASLKRFYERMASKEDKQPQYRIAHVLVSSGGLKRANRIWSEAKKAGSDFNQIAKDYSDDESTSQTGGDLGLFNRASINETFRKVITRMKPGEISKPIKMQDGYHIFKLLEKKTAGFDNLSPERKNQFRAMMMAKDGEEKMRLWIERKKRDAVMYQKKASAK